ncbi:MAG: sterol desaturase family protein [Ferruginibacter sp.]|nr:sterol desaturase family protein [Cytophagales bacterium]
MFIETLKEVDLHARLALIAGIMLLRYALFAGIAYWICYVWKRKAWEPKKIQLKYPTAYAVRQEILYSISTIGIFVGIGFLMRLAQEHAVTKVYTDIGRYGWGYLAVSVLLAILIHDTYFYWTHRFMHLTWVFPHVHRVHHRSHNPTPWAAFSFHPSEALIEASVFPVIAFLLPIHPLALFIVATWMITMNVLGHLGYELYPAGMLQHSVAKWLNTSTHHNMHHQHVGGNYGLYFNFWDKLVGTNFENYEKKFAENATGIRRRKRNEGNPSTETERKTQSVHA